MAGSGILVPKDRYHLYFSGVSRGEGMKRVHSRPASEVVSMLSSPLHMYSRGSPHACDPSLPVDFTQTFSMM